MWDPGWKKGPNRDGLGNIPIDYIQHHVKCNKVQLPVWKSDYTPELQKRPR